MRDIEYIQSDPIPTPDMGGVSSTLCDRAGGHVFMYSGRDMPDGWLCECGQREHESRPERLP